MTEQTTDSPATGMCTYGEGQASGSGCIERAGHDGAHLVTPGIPAERDWWRAPDSSAGPAPDQRAAVLLWAADIAESLRQFEPAFGARKSAQVSENVGVLRVADELRRMADEAQQDPTQDGEVSPDVDPVYDPKAWETYRRDAGCGCTAPAPVDCKIPHGTGAWLCACHRLSGPPRKNGDPRGTFPSPEEEALLRQFTQPNRCTSTDGIFRCSRPIGHPGDHRTGRTFWGRRAEDDPPTGTAQQPKEA